MTDHQSKANVGRPRRSAARRAPVGSGVAQVERDTGGDNAPAGNYHVAALTRGLSLLQVLAHHGLPMALAALEDQTSLPKSTLVRLLSVLGEAGYVQRIDERPTFWLGPSVMPLAEAYTSVLDISLSAKPVLESLASTSGQTVNIGILDGYEVVHLCVFEPNRPVRFRSETGSRDGTHQTGLGKLLLAFLASSSLAAHVPPEPFPARTARTITTKRGLSAELQSIRRCGFAFDNEEGDLGVCCLAVPIRRGGNVIAALSMAGPAAELAPTNHDRYLGLLRAAAVDLEADMQFQYAVAIARRALS